MADLWCNSDAAIIVTANDEQISDLHMLQGRLNIAFVALTVALGGFLLGFDANVISGVVPFIREYFSSHRHERRSETGLGGQQPGMGRDGGQCDGRRVERSVRPPACVARYCADVCVFVVACGIAQPLHRFRRGTESLAGSQSAARF